MRNFTLKSLLLVMALCVSHASWALDFVSNGLTYRTINNSAAVSVIAASEKYAGDVVIPATVTYEGKQYAVKSIAQYAFEGCSDMASVTLNEGLETIGDYAFQNCGKLKAIAIPNTVTAIGYRMCNGCKAMESATIGDGLKEIASYAFMELGNLKTVELGKKVNNIGNGAFTGSTAIATIVCKNPKPATWAYLDNTFSKSIYPTCTLYVPEGTSADYKAADGWKNFNHIVEGLPAGIATVTEDGGISVSAGNGAIILSGNAPATPYSVYDMGGKLIASGNTAAGSTTVRVDHAGIYVVKAGTTVAKAMVR